VDAGAPAAAEAAEAASDEAEATDEVDIEGDTEDAEPTVVVEESNA
jgi:hypothetical protein